MIFVKENWFYIVALVSFAIILIKGGIWIGSTNQRIGSLQNGVEDLKKGLAEVRNDIKKILFNISGKNTTESSSPLHLNDLGKEISDHVDAVGWAMENSGGLLNQARGKEEFEVFDICTHYVDSCFKENKEFIRIVKSVAYEHGIIDEQVLMVYRIQLRDQILALLEVEGKQ